MVERVEIDYSSEDQRLSWAAILELHALHPEGWTLIGGQMVHLHCWERGSAGSRVTTDADAGLDVRGFPKIAWSLTSTLQDIGFRHAGTTPNGTQHRWIRGISSSNDLVAQIDVVIPNAVGRRARERKSASGGQMFESFGVQQALNRSETIDVILDRTHGRVNRPTLLGGLISKAAALRNVGDDPDRHLEDFLTLAALLKVPDLQEALSSRDREHLTHAVRHLTRQGLLGSATSTQSRGISLLQAAANRQSS